MTTIELDSEDFLIRCPMRNTRELCATYKDKHGTLCDEYLGFLLCPYYNFVIKWSGILEHSERFGEN